VRGVTRTRALAALGTALLTGALALLVRASLAGTGEAGEAGGLAALVVLGGLAVAAWRLRSRPAAEDEAAGRADEPGDGGAVAYRRAGRYRLVEPAPERTDVDYPLAGQDVTELLARATETARSTGSVDAGIELVRPAFRGLLRDVLVAGGTDPEAAERTIERGTWTDDREAAAVVSGAVEPPRRSFRERLRAWLRPGSVARRRLDRAAGALAVAAEEALPALPGSTVPRRVRIPPPSLAELRRDIDGALRPSVGPVSGRRVPTRSGSMAGDGGPKSDDQDAGDGDRTTARSDGGGDP
jgi:hypothetical protein